MYYYYKYKKMKDMYLKLKKMRGGEEDDNLDNLDVPISRLNINQPICLFDTMNNEHKCYEITEHFNHILDDTVEIMRDTYESMVDGSMLNENNDYDYNKVTRECDFRFMYENQTSDDNLDVLNRYLKIKKKEVIKNIE